MARSRKPAISFQGTAIEDLIGGEILFCELADQGKLHDHCALRLSIFQEGGIVHSVNEFTDLLCGIENLREINAIILHKSSRYLALHKAASAR